jgi:uncharacterized protein (DUF1778 family)
MAFNVDALAAYTKANETKNYHIKVRLTEMQKNDLVRWAYNEDKTITQVVLEAIKSKNKKFPI